MNPGDQLSRRPGSLPDPWTGLRPLTAARIALGRAGGSVPTKAMLDFQLAHARARDAVHAEFDAPLPLLLFRALWDAIPDRPELGRAWSVQSAAEDAKTFLLRPDLGRRLGDEHRQFLLDMAAQKPQNPDVVIVVSDGLSPLAVLRHAPPLMQELSSLLKPEEWQLAKTVIAFHGRVAIMDEIGEILGAKLALILIGERPGLGSPDSLGAYMVYGPRVGNTDAHRNCVSNIRPEGLGYAEAARTIHYLLMQARRHRLSGVGLKDNSALLTRAKDGTDANNPA